MTSRRETLETVRYRCERCGFSYDSALQARACCLPNHGDDHEVCADGGSKMQICVLDEDEIDQLKRGGFWLNVDQDGDLILLVPEDRQEEALEAAMDHVDPDADRTVEKPDPGAIPDGGRLLQSPEQGCNCRHLPDGAVCVECSSQHPSGIPLAGGA